MSGWQVPAGAGREGKVDLVGAGLEGELVLGDADASGFMGMEDEVNLVAEELPRSLDRVIDLLGNGSSRRVLEADRVIRNAGVQDALQRVEVELGGMGPFRSGGSRGKFHHGDDDFVLEARVVDALAGIDKVVYVVQGVEVPDGRDSVLLEELGVELDDVPGLRIQADDVDAPREGLEVGLGARGLSEIVHHFEGVFVRVEIGRLIHGSATGFKMIDARCCGSFHDGKEVFRENSCSVNRLKTVPESGTHEMDSFFH